MNAHGFSDLGGKDKPEDQRDIKLGALTPKVYTFEPTLNDIGAWNAPVEYQGQQPACGAHAGAKKNELWVGHHATPRYTWKDIKSFDGNPIETGTDMRSVFKSITKTGTLDFALLQNDVTLSLSDYARPNFTPQIESLLKLNAGAHKSPGYGFADDLTFNGLKQYISDHGPIILLLRVGAEWWTGEDGVTSWAENKILPVRPPKSVVSGHFVMAHSYDENYIYFLNSWSADWGRKGHGYFGANYMPYINDAGTIIELAFTKDLYRGLTDPEVKELQQILNKSPQTQVAASGDGSPGHETTYFGNLTFAAVQKYQTLNGIPATGYCGPLTRARLNLE